MTYYATCQACGSAVFLRDADFEAGLIYHRDCRPQAPPPAPRLCLFTWPHDRPNATPHVCGLLAGHYGNCVCPAPCYAHYRWDGYGPIGHRPHRGEAALWETA